MNETANSLYVWIIHSTDSLKDANSFMNETADSLLVSHWIIQ